MEDLFLVRVWDKNNKEMIYLSHYEIDTIAKTIGVFTIFENCYDLEKELDLSHCMRSTGMKDRTGKLIYEGDIVIYSDQEGYWFIEWKGCQFVERLADNSDTNLLDDVGGEYLEIVGNIYENTELLD